MRRRILSAVSFLSVFAMALAPACGGASDPHDLLSGANGGSGTHDAGTDTSSHLPPDSGGGHDSSTVLDTGTGVVDTGVPLPEASPLPESGPPVGEFTCPPSTCQVPDVCCATGTGQGANPAFKCQAATKACGSTAGPGTPISCATSADCSGEICCGANTNGFYSRVSCQPTCDGMDATGATLITFCDPALNDCPTATPTCQPSQILKGFNVCN